MAVRISAQLERLRQTDQQRRELIANVSHDLRTPLTALQGYLETVTLKGDTLRPQERQQYLELAAGQGQRLERLVSNLFELAKLESSEKPLAEEVFSACDLAQDVAEKFKLAAADRGITLTAEFETDLPRVRADIQLIERLLENLIENALRFTPQAGRVIVRCRLRGAKMAIEVRDSGVGIAAEDLPFIFDRFYRGRKADGSTAGAGLGLAISKRIVDMHGEAVTVESPPEGGRRSCSRCRGRTVRKTADGRADC
jgi:signal transduction histidine kinase